MQSEESYDGSIFGEESEPLESEEGEEVIWLKKINNFRPGGSSWLWTSYRSGPTSSEIAHIPPVYPTARNSPQSYNQM